MCYKCVCINGPTSRFGSGSGCLASAFVTGVWLVTSCRDRREQFSDAGPAVTLFIQVHPFFHERDFLPVLVVVTALRVKMQTVLNHGQQKWFTIVVKLLEQIVL